MASCMALLVEGRMSVACRLLLTGELREKGSQKSIAVY